MTRTRRDQKSADRFAPYVAPISRHVAELNSADSWLPGTKNNDAGAERLARLAADLLPDEPEAHGLVAALLHSEARAAARRDAAGAFVALDQQDVQRWLPQRMADAERHLAAAAVHRRPGPYQLQAAIQSVHNRRAITGSTDWSAIAACYDQLIGFTPSIGAHVARAAAYLQAGSPAQALTMLDGLDQGLVSATSPTGWCARTACTRPAPITPGAPGWPSASPRIRRSAPTSSPPSRHGLPTRRSMLLAHRHRGTVVPTLQ